MTLSIHDTSEWSADAIDWPAVMRCLRRYAARFPNDMTIPALVEEIASGKLRLWVIRDENGGTVAAVLTTIETVTATGWTRVIVQGMGGLRGIEAAPLIAEIENWGASQGAHEAQVIGRAGWKRLLAGLGYREAAVVLRKAL